MLQPGSGRSHNSQSIWDLELSAKIVKPKEKDLEVETRVRVNEADNRINCK